ncbi:hypothetical protein LTR10_023718 [Elasticomyces elasticus]|nr:hypothetical protein LTR10_023718 [Elasticomyces elasticus]
MAVEYAQSLRYNIPGSEDALDGLNISFYQHAANIRALRKRSHKGNSFVALPELIISARYCKATETRDKLFSMLGLADPEIYQIHADYRLSLVEQDSEVAFDGDALLVKGFVFDTIVDLCETIVTPDASFEQIDHIHQSWQVFFEQRLDDLTVAYGPIPSRVREEKERMWMDFLTTDNSASRFIKCADDGSLLPEREEQLKLQYMGLNLKLARSYLLPADFEGGLHPQRRVRAALKKFGPGRQLGLCANKTKAMILLPGDARPGDVVAIFRGATFPYILRKCIEGEEYVLVGEAYMPAYATNKAISMGLRTEANIIRIV